MWDKIGLEESLFVCFNSELISIKEMQTLTGAGDIQVTIGVRVDALDFDDKTLRGEMHMRKVCQREVKKHWLSCKYTTDSGVNTSCLFTTWLS